MTEEEIGHVEWLKSLPTDFPKSSLIADRSLTVWTILKRLFGDHIKVPAACYSGDSNQLLYCWDEGDQHFELDLMEKRIEWFYRNRTTEEARGGEVSI